VSFLDQAAPCLPWQFQHDLAVHGACSFLVPIMFVARITCFCMKAIMVHSTLLATLWCCWHLLLHPFQLLMPALFYLQLQLWAHSISLPGFHQCRGQG